MLDTNTPANNMDNPTTAPWGLTISNKDFKRLRDGFEAEDMDQHWHVFSQQLDQDEQIAVHIARCGTDEDFYILKVVAAKDNESAKIEAITWETKHGQPQVSEEEGKEEAVDLCRGMLGCDFESLKA